MQPSWPENVNVLKAAPPQKVPPLCLTGPALSPWPRGTEQRAKAGFSERHCWEWSEHREVLVSVETHDGTQSDKCLFTHPS